MEDMKNMAKAAGQPIPEYTPPDGETMDQVSVYKNRMRGWILSRSLCYTVYF